MQAEFIAKDYEDAAREAKEGPAAQVASRMKSAMGHIMGTYTQGWQG